MSETTTGLPARLVVLSDPSARAETIKAARFKYGGDDVTITPEARVFRDARPVTNPHRGAWVEALVWIGDDEL